VSRKADFCLGTSGALFPEMGWFFSTQIALPLLDRRAHPEGLGIVMAKT